MITSTHLSREPSPEPDVMNSLELTWSEIDRDELLHHAATLSDPYAYLDGETSAGTTTCGMAVALSIPGMFTRMGATRCDHCCAATGVPEGVGSPKNDENAATVAHARIAAMTAEGDTPNTRSGRQHPRVALPGTDLSVTAGVEHIVQAVPVQLATSRTHLVIQLAFPFGDAHWSHTDGRTTCRILDSHDYIRIRLEGPEGSRATWTVLPTGPDTIVLVAPEPSA